MSMHTCIYMYIYIYMCIQWPSAQPATVPELRARSTQEHAR